MNRTQIAEGRGFAFLVIFVKLDFRHSNFICIAILSLLIVKTNSLAIFW